jgi:hypothetical protein
MSQDIGDNGPAIAQVRLSFRGGSWWSSGGLVVAAWVDGELAEELAGGGVDDAEVQVVDEQDDVGSGVGSADADVA